MIAKLIVDGVDRDTARRRLARALDQLVIGGLTTNAGFHRWLIDQQPVVAGRVTTRFLDETDLPPAPPPALAEAAAAWRAAKVSARGTSVWEALGAFRVTPHRNTQPVGLRTLDGELHESPDGRAESSDAPPVACVSLDQRSLAINVGGHTHSFTVPTRSERWAPVGSEGHGHASAIVAPFPGAVT
jgi:acetyl/propionyl-CoA carboxylase alpha subunit